MLPTYKHPMYKVIPFENYYWIMLLSGLPLEEIKSLLMVAAFNPLPDDVYGELEESCRAVPGWSPIITANRRRYTKRQPIDVPDSILNEFKFSAYARDLVNYFDNKTHNKVFRSTNRVKKIIERWDERAFLEIAVLQNIPLSEFMRKWNAVHSSKSQKISREAASAFIYYYWNVTWKRMDNLNFSIHDVADYIGLNKRSRFYDTHRYLMFRQPEELFHYFGVMTDNERMMISKSILGDAVRVIRTAQRAGRPVPADAIDLFKLINGELAVNARDSKDADVYRSEIERIVSRLSVVKKERETIADLKLITSDAPLEDTELDKPFYVKK